MDCAVLLTARRKEVGRSYVQIHLLALGTTQYIAPLLVGLTRFELVTPRLSSVCSNQLSYRPSILAMRSKNRRPVLSKLDKRAIPHNHCRPARGWSNNTECQIDL